MILKKREKKEKFFDELMESELINLKGRLDSYHKNLIDIEKDGTASATSKATALEKNSKAHSITLNEVLAIIGKPNKIKKTEANVKHSGLEGLGLDCIDFELAKKIVFKN